MPASAPETPRAIRSVWPAVAVTAFGAGLLLWAQSYSETAARVPSLVAAIMILLGLIDLWSRSGLPGQALVAGFWGTEFTRREMAHDPPLREEAAIVLWIVGCFVGFAVIGILPATPLFCALYVWRRGGRPVLVAAAIGAMVFAFQYGVFEWLLDYRLYRGLLFSEGGLARW